MHLKSLKMKSIGGQGRIKRKVFSGFVLLLLLSGAAVFILIQLASRLTPPDTGESQSVTKLSIVSSLLSTLIDADGQARAYITTGSSKYLDRYTDLEIHVHQLTDSLKALSLEHPEQYLRMAVVDSLVRQKKTALENHMKRKQMAGSALSSSERLEGIVDRFSDTIDVSYKTYEEAVVPLKSSEEGSDPQKKEGFFKRIWGGISGKHSPPDTTMKESVEKIMRKDTILSYTKISDTAISQIREQLKLMSRQDQIERQLSIERELMLLRTDQSILDEIRNVLLLFEKEEINRAIAGAENSREILSKLWNTALIAAITSLIIMLIFLVMIWKDLARSNFYRKKLEEARKIAEKLLKVKEMFLANMSHEIRTPITSIIGFSEKLSGTRLNQTQGRYLNYINSSSDHLLRLIDDLLDFSRIESGKLGLDARHFFPALLMKEIFETMSPRAKLKGLETKLILKIDPNLKVTGDDLRIRQILLNLLNNSIKFTSNGSVTLTAKAAINNGMADLQISVSDTGIGIPKEKQVEIFNEFTQVDIGTTRKYGGSGLGLAISQKLTRLMNGEIRLESEPGKGTTIKVTLPLPLYDGPISESRNTNNNSIPDLSDFRILVAEDDETTRILITENLLTSGAFVREADNGQTAWDVFVETEGDFDLVITDIQMPGLSGIELTKNITGWFAAEKIEPCPILGLTAHSSPEEMKHYHSVGMTRLLMKPFKQADFYARILKLLELYHQEFNESSKESGNVGYPDISVFRQFANDDTKALKKILTSLTEGLSETIESMKQAFEEKDYATISLLAHRALPNVRNLGDKETASKLQLLERLRGNKIPDNKAVNEMLASAIEGMARLKDAVDDID